MNVRVRLKKEFFNRYAFTMHKAVLDVQFKEWSSDRSEFLPLGSSTCFFVKDHFEEIDENGEPLGSIKPELYPVLVRLGCKIDNQIATWNHETARLDAVRSFLSGFLEKHEGGDGSETVEALKDSLKDYEEAATEAIDWFNRIYHEMKRKEQQ